MKISAFGVSNVGLVRKNNEDSFHVDEENGIFIVCDGVGGSKAGEVASSMAISETIKFLNQEKEYLKLCQQQKVKDDEIFKFFADALRHSCYTIFETSRKDASLRNMATTLTMAVKINNKMLICHVGDSRAYILKKNSVHQISEDHTLVKDFLRKGLIKCESDAADFMHSTLTRSLGTYKSVEVDCIMVNVDEGNKLVLCTDGVSGYLKESDDLLKLVKNDSVEKDAQDLITFALKNKGQDNATAIVLEILEDTENEVEFMLESVVMEVLELCPAYKGLSYSQLSRMRSHMEIVHLRKSEVLVQACEKYNGFYIILEGGIMSGDEQLIRGESVGLKALLNDHYSPNEKYAVRDTKLLHFSRKTFENFSKRYPSISNIVLRNYIDIH